jgi:hypothetical protein
VKRTIAQNEDLRDDGLELEKCKESNHVWKDVTRIVLSSGSANHHYLPAWFPCGHDLEQARAPRVAFYDWLRYSNPREKKAIYRTTITNRAMLPNSGIL